MEDLENWNNDDTIDASNFEHDIRLSSQQDRTKKAFETRSKDVQGKIQVRRLSQERKMEEIENF